jgi:lipopolysaccharide export system protein LptA
MGAVAAIDAEGNGTAAMRWIGRSGAALLLVATGWGVWYLVAGPGGVTANGTEPGVSEPPALETEGHTSILWHERGGRAVKTCEVSARRFSVSADGRTRTLEGITKAIFYQDGRIVARAQAGRAIEDLSRNELRVEGGVRVRLEDGRARVASESAHWSASRQRLTFPHSLLLTGPDASRFRAASAAVDARARQVRLRKVNGVAGSARIASPVCDYRLSDHTLVMTPLDYRAPGVQLKVARARLDTRANIFHGDRVSMKATVRDLLRPGGALMASATLAALLGATHAEAAPAAGAPKKAIKHSEFQVEGYGSVKYEEGKRAVLQRGVLIRHKDTTFRAERVELTLEGKDVRLAVATGTPEARPQAVDPRNTVTGDKFTIYPEEKRLVVEGTVKVVTRPKENAPEEKAGAPGERTGAPADKKGPLRDTIKGDTVITGDRLEYDYRRKNLIAEGSALKVVNKQRTLTARRLTYADKTEDLVLEGDPIQYRDEKGNELSAAGPWKFNLKEGIETLEINQPFTGKFLVKEEEEDEEDAEKPKAQAAAKPQ